MAGACRKGARRQLLRGCAGVAHRRRHPHRAAGAARRDAPCRAPCAAIRCRRGSSMQRIDDPDPARANRQALEDIAQGATGLALVFEGAPNAFGYGLPAKPEALAIALDDIPLNRIHICARRASGEPRHASTGWSRYLSKRRVDPAKLSLSFGIDPAAIFAGTGRLRMSIEALQGVDAAVAGAFLRARRAGRPARRRRPRLPQCRRDRGAGARRRARLRRLASADVRGGAAGARLCRAAYRLFASASTRTSSCRWPRSGRCALLWARVQEACSIPPARGVDPCRDVLPDDDGEGPGNQHPAHHDRRLRGGRRRRRFDRHPAAHDRARPAGRLCPPHRPQHAARSWPRKAMSISSPIPASGSGSVESADRRAVRGGLGGIPARSKRKAASCESLVAGRIQSRIVAARDRRGRGLSRRQARRSSARRSIRPARSGRSRRSPPSAARRATRARSSASASQPLRIDETIGHLA